MGASVPPQIDPADLWDWLVSQKKLSAEQATLHVNRYLQSVNPETTKQIQAELDPGKLASFGMGVSQAGTLGFGDEAAGLIEGLGAAVVPGGRGFSQAYRDATGAEQLTREKAREFQPEADWGGEIAGSVPAAAGALWTKAPQIASLLGRAGARIGIGSAKGAGLAFTEAAGRADGAGVGERMQRGADAAPLGAIAGALLPLVPKAARLAGRYVAKPVRAVAGSVRDFVETIAGKAPASSRLPRIRADIIPGTPGVRPMNGPVQGPPDPMRLPTFLRRGGTQSRPGLPIVPPNPLALTGTEQAANLGAQSLKTRVREAARVAYQLAVAAGQTPAQALDASRRAAALAARGSLLSP